MNLALYDSAVTPLESGNGSGGSVTVQHLVTAFDIQPFKFIAFALDNYYGDYTIDISEAP
jgi:hypothetical protein